MKTHDNTPCDGAGNNVPEVGLTYRDLVSVIEKRRRAELREVRPDGKNHDAQVRGTLAALRGFMEVNGLSSESRVGAEILEPRGFDLAMNLLSKDKTRDQSTIRRMRSEMNRRIRTWAAAAIDEISSQSDAETFSERLTRLMDRAGRSGISLGRAIGLTGEAVNSWRRGGAPGPNTEFAVASLERELGVPRGYLASTIRSVNHSRTFDLRTHGVARSRQRRLVEHLPHDFGMRSRAEQQEIIDWVEANILSAREASFKADAAPAVYALSRRDTATRLQPAPIHLVDEIDKIREFKTVKLVPVGLKRNKPWSPVISTKFEQHVMMMAGALVDTGIPLKDVSLSMCLFPQVIDAYIGWRHTRRGDHTRTISMILIYLESLLHPMFGYIAQAPDSFSCNLREVQGLISKDAVRAAQDDWGGACSVARAHISDRLQALEKLMIVGRDPFEPIEVVLDTKNPLSEYLKIVDEIRARMRHRDQTPVRWAEDQRAIMSTPEGLCSAWPE